MKISSIHSSFAKFSYLYQDFLEVIHMMSTCISAASTFKSSTTRYICLSSSQMCVIRPSIPLFGGRAHIWLIKTHIYLAIDVLNMLTALKNVDVIYGWCGWSLIKSAHMVICKHGPIRSGEKFRFILEVARMYGIYENQGNWKWLFSYLYSSSCSHWNQLLATSSEIE